MKYVLLFVCCMTAAGSFAQQVLNKAIVKIKVETTSDNSGDGGIQIPNNETNVKMFLRDSLRKTVTENSFMNNIIIYDGDKGITTNLTESMGEKTGYTQTREDILDQRRRMDSIMKAREGEGAQPGRMNVRMGGVSNVTNIDYRGDAKVINKINCKKAIVTARKDDGTEQKIEVWYTPDYKLPGGAGATRGGLNLSQLNGLPVMYETVNTMNFNGNEISLTMHYEITSIEQNAQIADKEFEVPKGYTVKTYQQYIKDNPDGMPGMRRTIRMGGR